MILGQLDIDMQKHQVGLIINKTQNGLKTKLNLRRTNIKLSEDVGITSHDLGLGNIFLGMTLKA